MRKDILIDEEEDLLIKNTVNPMFSVGVYDGEYDGKSVLAVPLQALGNNNLDQFRTGTLSINTYVKLPANFAGTNYILVYFYHIDRNGLEIRSPKLLLINGKAQLLDVNGLHEVSPGGHLVKYLKDIPVTYEGYKGALVAENYEQGDFAIDNSIPQNEKMLLLASKGNILEHPLKGADVIADVNGNVDRDTMREKIVREFEKDELEVLHFEVVTKDGMIIIRSNELYDIED
jgi:hypothetical protein